MKRPGVLVASGLLLAAIVATGAPALAAPVFDDDGTYVDTYGYGYAYDTLNGTGCTYLTDGFSSTEPPVVENGPAVTASTSGSATFDTNDGSDTATGTGSATGTGKVTSVDGNLDSLDFTSTSSATLTNALGTSPGCRRLMQAGAKLEFEFDVSEPGFLTITAANRGSHSYGEVYIYRDAPGADTRPYVDTYGEGMSFTSTIRTYLPPGTYNGYFQGQTGAYSQSSFDASSRFTAHGDFTVAGSRTSAVSGTAKRQVRLPAMRSCATHQLVSKVTGKKIKSVTFLVNGKKATTVRSPKKGQTVKLSLADGSTAKVKAVVRTIKNGKAVTTTVGTSYEACS